MQEVQHCLIVEWCDEGQDGGQQIDRPVGLGDKALQMIAGVEGLLGRVRRLEQQALAFVGAVLRRQPGKGQMIPALEMRPFRFQIPFALLIEQP